MKACTTTLESLYASVDGALSAERTQEVSAHIDDCQSCGQTVARIELSYREQIHDFLTGRDVGLPPSSPFVQRALATMQARLGVDASQRSPAVMSDAVRAVLSGTLPEPAAAPPMRARRARRKVDSEDEEPA